MRLGVAVKFHPADDGNEGRTHIRRAVLVDGIDNGIHANFGQGARLPGCRIPVHVEHQAREDVVSRHSILNDHLPDLWHRQRRWPRGIRARQNAV